MAWSDEKRRIASEFQKAMDILEYGFCCDVDPTSNSDQAVCSGCVRIGGCALRPFPRFENDTP